ncbi:MAG TPA: zf-HC2 domain-containing protein [Planctomycetes bacterium]|nr:zf-HC2 domain-containing protein [Planctomycetota bacterium]
MMACPEPLELSAWMDGELSEQSAKLLREHVHSCFECRSRVHAYRRLAHGLEKDIGPPLESNYEERFHARLLARMSTGEEMRRARSLVRPAAALVAGFLLTLGGALWLRRAETSPNPPGSSITVGAAMDSSAELASVERELAQWLEGHPDDDEIRPRLIGFERRLRSCGSSLSRTLIGWIRGGRGTPALPAVLAAIRNRDQRHYLGALRDLVQDTTRSAEERFRALDVLADLDVDAVRGLLGPAIAAGYPVDSAIDHWMKLGKRRDLIRLEEQLSRLEGEAFRRAVVHLARSTAGAKVLVDLWVGGRQEESLVVAISSRSDVVPHLRSLAFGGATRQKDRERAIELLGILRDKESLPQLERFFLEGRFLVATTEALGRIGGAKAALLLPRRIRLSDWARPGRQLKMLGRAIRRFGDEGAALYLKRIKAGNDPYQMQYVCALRYSASKKLLPELYGLLDRDDIRWLLVDVIADVGGIEAVDVLGRLADDVDGRVRHRARARLIRLAPKRLRRAWQGFVFLRRPSGMPAQPDSLTRS